MKAWLFCVGLPFVVVYLPAMLLLIKWEERHGK